MNNQALIQKNDRQNKKQVIVIGGGESWDTYEEYIAYLKEKNYDPYENYGEGWKKLLQDALGEVYDVIYVLMPSRANAKYDEWVIWFEKLLPYMQNDVSLVGHSLGGALAINFAARFPSKVAGVFLVSPVINSVESMPPFIIKKGRAPGSFQSRLPIF